MRVLQFEKEEESAEPSRHLGVGMSMQRSLSLCDLTASTKYVVLAKLFHFLLCMQLFDFAVT